MEVSARVCIQGPGFNFLHQKKNEQKIISFCLYVFQFPTFDIVFVYVALLYKIDLKPGTAPD